MLFRPNPPNRRGTDPYARWCGRGGVARRPPIPIDGGCARLPFVDQVGQRNSPSIEQRNIREGGKFMSPREAFPMSFDS